MYTQGKKIHHETLSRLIFKKILLDNPKVLAIFVKDCKMTVDEVKKVEKMICPNAPEFSGVHVVSMSVVFL